MTRVRAAIATIVATIVAWASIGVLDVRVAAAEPTIAVLAPPPRDDARGAVALGPHGEVYAPDGKGAWVRTQRFTTAGTLVAAGRADGAVVAAGDGAVYKLADNGWSAIRLHQKDKATLGAGSRAVAAVKRQLYALHFSQRGEPEQLAVAPSPILAIGAGKTIVLALDRGLARVVGKGKVEMIAGAPRRVVELLGDRWARLATGVHDLRANKTIAWPPGVRIAAAAIGPDDGLIAVARRAGKLELLALGDRSLVVQPVDLGAPAASVVGVAVDRAGRVVIAFDDGRIAVRERGAWTMTSVTTRFAADRPGPGPARSP